MTSASYNGNIITIDANILANILERINKLESNNALREMNFDNRINKLEKNCKFVC